MATIAQTTVSGVKAPVAVVKTPLTGTDALTYSAGTGQVLEFTNTSSSVDATITIDGAGSTTIQPDGYGKTIDVSGGFQIPVAKSTSVAVPLDSIKVWLVGAVAVTGGNSSVLASITV